MKNEAKQSQKLKQQCSNPQANTELYYKPHQNTSLNSHLTLYRLNKINYALKKNFKLDKKAKLVISFILIIEVFALA